MTQLFFVGSVDFGCFTCQRANMIDLIQNSKQQCCKIHLVYLCFIMQCMMPLWATTSVETNKGIRTKHEHRQPRKFCHAHITIIYIVSATKEILIKWGKKCVLVMPKATGKKDRMAECVCN